jgi:hypothetical protein
MAVFKDSFNKKNISLFSQPPFICLHHGYLAIVGENAGRNFYVVYKQINTGGGAYIEGDVNTGGGDFVGRDKIITSRHI